MGKKMMDRIFERLQDINKRWLSLVEWSVHENWTPERLQEEFDILRQEFANIISLAQQHAWRIIAQAEGVQVDDLDEFEERQP